MKIVWLFLIAISCGLAHAAPHVVIVTPRGETKMEQIFEEELVRRIGAVRFTMIVPDTANRASMSELWEKVLKEKPDLIYSWGTPTTVALAGTYEWPVIADIPIVFGVVADPLSAKLVKNLDRPARNITGTSHLAPLPVQLLALNEYRAIKTLGVVYNPTEVNARNMVEKLKVETKKLGIALVAEPVGLTPDGRPDPKTISETVALVKEQGAQWLYLGPDTFIGFTHRKLTTDASLKAGLPAFSANESAIRDANALLGLFSPIENMARLMAWKASQILSKEVKVEDIPIETLQQFSVLINMCAAKALQLFPPLGLLSYAGVRVPPVPKNISVNSGGLGTQSVDVCQPVTPP